MSQVRETLYGAGLNNAAERFMVDCCLAQPHEFDLIAASYVILDRRPPRPRPARDEEE